MKVCRPATSWAVRHGLTCASTASGSAAGHRRMHASTDTGMAAQMIMVTDAPPAPGGATRLATAVYSYYRMSPSAAELVTVL